MPKTDPVPTSEHRRRRCSGHSHSINDYLGLTGAYAVGTILLRQFNFAFDGPGAEALVVWVITGKVAVFPDAEFGVSACVGDSLVLAHFFVVV
jgi:hypothetical protein